MAAIRRYKLGDARPRGTRPLGNRTRARAGRGRSAGHERRRGCWNLGPDADAPPKPTPDADADAELHPPHLLEAPAPQYPPGREDGGLHPTVVIRLTVTAEARSPTSSWSTRLASTSTRRRCGRCRTGSFDPATRGDTPVSSRIRVAVHFEPTVRRRPARR